MIIIKPLNKILICRSICLTLYNIKSSLNLISLIDYYHGSKSPGMEPVVWSPSSPLNLYSYNSDRLFVCKEIQKFHTKLHFLLSVLNTIGIFILYAKDCPKERSIKFKTELWDWNCVPVFRYPIWPLWRFVGHHVTFMEHLVTVYPHPVRRLQKPPLTISKSLVTWRLKTSP